MGWLMAQHYIGEEGGESKEGEEAVEGIMGGMDG